MDKTDELIRAMKTLILFVEMYDFCMNRVSQNGKSACTGCPYKKKDVCGKRSTIEVMRSISEVFQEYLEQ